MGPAVSPRDNSKNHVIATRATTAWTRTRQNQGTQKAVKSAVRTTKKSKCQHTAFELLSRVRWCKQALVACLAWGFTRSKQELHYHHHRHHRRRRGSALTLRRQEPAPDRCALSLKTGQVLGSSDARPQESFVIRLALGVSDGPVARPWQKASQKALAEEASRERLEGDVALKPLCRLKLCWL